MNVSIGNLKNCRGDETDAFSCSVWVDGKKVAEIRQAGQGGPHEWRWEAGADREAMLAWGKDQAPRILGDVLDFSEGWHRSEALDAAVWDLVNRALVDKMLRRHCRTQVLFRLAGDEDGEWRAFRCPWKGNEDQVRDQLGREHGDALLEIANERFQ